jgi:hypothetical protein
VREAKPNDVIASARKEWLGFGARMYS